VGVVLSVTPLGGCSLIVGDPHGTHASLEDGAAAAARDATSGMDAPSGADTSLAIDGGTDATLATDSGAGGDSAFDGSDATSDAAADAGSDAMGGADGASDADAGGCPGTAGPPAVRIVLDAGSYCIDTLEITNAQYAAFLASGFTIPGPSVPPACVGITSFVPLGGWPSPYMRLPVVEVTWCDAYAYCLWAGKRLCGEIGGGPLPQPEVANPALSQWYAACSGGGALTYPYGNTFDVTICGGERTINVQNVGTPAQCVGGFPGLYNMSGNVWEWTDSCQTINNGCYTMGGAFDGTMTDLECASNRSWWRDSGAANLGFRCCSDP
jgi:formylglycine-generating enzyme required for sulfatase activity